MCHDIFNKIVELDFLLLQNVQITQKLINLKKMDNEDINIEGR